MSELNELNTTPVSRAVLVKVLSRIEGLHVRLECGVVEIKKGKSKWHPFYTRHPQQWVCDVLTACKRRAAAWAAEAERKELEKKRAAERKAILAEVADIIKSRLPFDSMTLHLTEYDVFKLHVDLKTVLDEIKEYDGCEFCCEKEPFFNIGPLKLCIQCFSAGTVQIKGESHEVRSLSNSLLGEIADLRMMLVNNIYFLLFWFFTCVLFSPCKSKQPTFRSMRSRSLLR